MVSVGEVVRHHWCQLIEAKQRSGGLKTIDLVECGRVRTC